MTRPETHAEDCNSRPVFGFGGACTCALTERQRIFDIERRDEFLAKLLVACLARLQRRPLPMFEPIYHALRGTFESLCDPKFFEANREPLEALLAAADEADK